ncbi:unnamed protein product [Thelazia callipaeda]|uniref:Ground-like domain-containing protein n=1 Tax=Thelazia callipaeda TaxID=103827 RepID=A0A0N5CX76_THECL|nr:unnamed protein product [Thelazia callipaeda]
MHRLNFAVPICYGGYSSLGGSGCSGGGCGGGGNYAAPPIAGPPPPPSSIGAGGAYLAQPQPITYVSSGSGAQQPYGTTGNTGSTFQWLCTVYPKNYECIIQCATGYSAVATGYNAKVAMRPEISIGDSVQSVAMPPVNIPEQTLLSSAGGQYKENVALPAQQFQPPAQPRASTSGSEEAKLLQVKPVDNAYEEIISDHEGRRPVGAIRGDYSSVPSNSEASIGTLSRAGSDTAIGSGESANYQESGGAGQNSISVQPMPEMKYSQAKESQLVQPKPAASQESYQGQDLSSSGKEITDGASEVSNSVSFAGYDDYISGTEVGYEEDRGSVVDSRVVDSPEGQSAIYQENPPSSGYQVDDYKQGNVAQPTIPVAERLPPVSSIDRELASNNGKDRNAIIDQTSVESDGLTCNDEDLKNIVEAALTEHQDNLDAARKIESEASRRFGGRFNSIVSDSEFAYVNWYGKRNCQLQVHGRHSLTWED